ncbi:hypothetical protein [Clostridium oceanicum]|uniref:DUF8042 domain-containing protein n=1 Tax=Clostridium oceanicum TaxID=1543 RepID=A0ABP3V4L9_9CLOT
MNDYIDVIKKTMVLSDSLNDGLEYIKERIVLKEYEEVDDMIKDTILATKTIYKALNPVFLEIKDVELKNNMEKLLKNLISLEDKIEAGDVNAVCKTIDKKVVPTYDLWKEKLDCKLKKYTYC